MKAILTITVIKEITEEDKNLYEELLKDGDITAIEEIFEPSYNGKYEIIFINYKDHS